jgi:hypothetical protein
MPTNSIIIDINKSLLRQIDLEIHSLGQAQNMAR